MKPKTLVLMGVAIACGLGASYMTSRLLAERNTDDDQKVVVLVAKKSLNMGDTIRSPEEIFHEKKFVRGDEPKDAIDSMDQLKNRILKRPLRVGDHVTPDDLLGDGDRSGLGYVVPDGYRAIGVRVNPESAASGWATLPLSRVDLISVVRSAADRTTYSQILLENVLVLAADSEMRRDDSGKPIQAQVVTLALKPEDVLKVTLARSLGELSLSLRKVNAKDKVDSTKLTAEALKTGQGPSNDDPPETVASSKSPETTPPPPPVVETPVKPDDPPVVDTKPALTRFIRTISEGGNTRVEVFWMNDRGEVVLSEVSGDHPPRPSDATEPKNK